MTFRFVRAGAATLAALSLGLAASAKPTPAGNPGWTQVQPASTVVGVDGKTYTPSCSGFPGTDPTFSFWAQLSGKRNLAIYLEGGGACWDNLTCSLPVAGLPPQVPQFYVPQVPPGTDPAQMDGVFRQGDPANPVADWDKVYIPYCTGDIHIGSATRTYTSIGHPVLPVPAGAPVTIQHRGFDNFMAVLAWLKQSLPQMPQRVLVAGSSAGGYGATANSPWVRRSFPGAQLYVVADASQGVTTANFDAGLPGRKSWNPQLDAAVFRDGDTPMPGNELMRRAAQADPNGRYGQFSTSLDLVQINFYGAMKQFYGPGGSCPNPALDWQQQMVTTLAADARDLRNFRHYLAAGQYHTLLRSPQMYAEQSAGPVFATWLSDMLAGRGPAARANDQASENGQGHRQGGHWRNESCPGCLQALPCF